MTKVYIIQVTENYTNSDLTSGPISYIDVVFDADEITIGQAEEYALTLQESLINGTQLSGHNTDILVTVDPHTVKSTVS